MFGSIFTGLSGMNTFSNALRQISNNITNLNSNGFKSSKVTFTGLFGSSSAGASSDVGQGVGLAHSTLDFAQGELRQTDRDLDLAIDGEGFLVLLRDADKVFARTGSFEINENGDIVLSGTNYRLTVLDATGNPSAVNVSGFRTNPPQATTTIQFADNLSSTANTYDLPDVKVFSAQGEAATWHVNFSRETTDPAGEWKVKVTNAGTPVGDVQVLRFLGGNVDPSTAHLTFDDGAGRAVDFDFSGDVSSFSTGTVSTLRAGSVNGFASGDITGMTVNANGEIEIGYSNEQKKTLGAITIATFRDPQSLHQQTGGIFEQLSGSGVDYYPSTSGRVGTVEGKRLEASNVDLTKEFGDLILVQRGFQASSQVVSVSNDMIQQLFGIRGQG